MHPVLALVIAVVLFALDRLLGPKMTPAVTFAVVLLCYALAAGILSLAAQ